MRRSHNVACPFRPLRSLSFVILFVVASYSIFYLTYPEQAYSVVPDYLKPKPVDQPGPPKPTPTLTWDERAEKVKAAFKHAYNGYEFYAAPSDELRPLSNYSVNNFNGWGVTAVDSLDTMLLMNLTDEFRRARQLTSRVNFDTISASRLR